MTKNIKALEELATDIVSLRRRLDGLLFTFPEGSAESGCLNDAYCLLGEAGDCIAYAIIKHESCDPS